MLVVCNFWQKRWISQFKSKFKFSQKYRGDTSAEPHGGVRVPWPLRPSATRVLLQTVTSRWCRRTDFLILSSYHLTLVIWLSSFCFVSSLRVRHIDCNWRSVMSSVFERSSFVAVHGRRQLLVFNWRQRGGQTEGHRGTKYHSPASLSEAPNTPAGGGKTSARAQGAADPCPPLVPPMLPNYIKWDTVNLSVADTDQESSEFI